MKKTILLSFVLILSCAMSKIAQAQDGYTVTVAEAQNGTVTVTPALPSNGVVRPGTKITVIAKPNNGYVFDASYYTKTVEGSRFSSRVESSLSELELTVTSNMTVGATFVEASKLQNINVTYDVVYAQPGVKKLKYDVYAPKNAKNLPCIVIIHGGGWSSNTEEVMRGLSRDLVANGKYVVFNIDYRWINTGDGDTKPNKMNDLINDVFGAIAHIQEHAKEYGGDPSKIGVTGDSAGGHLSACAANLCSLIGDKGWGNGVYEFMPTYMPNGKSIKKVRKQITKAIKAAAPSYGVFDASLFKQYMGDASEAEMRAVSPIYHVPNVKERAVPQYLLRGSKDNLISDESVKNYVAALEKAGQKAYYVIVDGYGHAFLDWKCDERTQGTYNAIGHEYALKMRDFFDGVFYK